MGEFSSTVNKVNKTVVAKVRTIEDRLPLKVIPFPGGLSSTLYKILQFT